MRIRNAVAALAAAALPFASLAFAGSASAATPSCTPNFGSVLSSPPSSQTNTIFDCLTPFNQEFGLNDVWDVYKAQARVGQPIILFQNNTHDGAEDFSYYDSGLVSEFCTVGLMSPGMCLHYGGGSIAGTDNLAFEAEYTPYGRPTNLCVGVGTTARHGTLVNLQPCGETAQTVWVLDFSESNCPPSLSGLPDGYLPLINGSNANFSHPYVLSYPSNGVAPWDRPRPQLMTDNLSVYSDGTVFDSQMWGLTYSGPQQSFPPSCFPFFDNLMSNSNAPATTSGTAAGTASGSASAAGSGSVPGMAPGAAAGSASHTASGTAAAARNASGTAAAARNTSGTAAAARNASVH